VDKLAPGIKVMLVPSNSPFILPIPTEELVEPANKNTQPTQVPGGLPAAQNSTGLSLSTPTPAFPINTATPAPQQEMLAITPTVYSLTPAQ